MSDCETSMMMKREPISLRERIERYIDACPPAISGQNGHDQTFRAACILVQGFDLSPEDAFSFLVRYNQRCEPPWTERELRHKLTDADHAWGYKLRGYLL
jgi:putative DNA primase/helicase